MTSLQERLFTMQYAAFHAKLTPGVPMESFIASCVLRKFAKEFTKEKECEEFLQQLSSTNTTMRTCFTVSSFPR